MSMLIKVNGVVRTDFVRYRTLQIRKDGALETARMEFIDSDLANCDVVDGDHLHITQDGGLEFGGEVLAVRVQRMDRTAHGTTTTVIDAQGWRFEADDVVVTVSFPSQPLLNTVATLASRFMAAKGWTNIGAPTGGPVMPAFVFTRQSVGAIFDELQKQSLNAGQAWTWRVNGDRQFGFGLVGTLPAPVDLTSLSGSVVLSGVSWSRERLRQATRVLATTGGSGRVAWTDTHTGDGARVYFPLTVLPNNEAPPTQVVEGGVTHALPGARWTYDTDDGAVRATTPVATGATVSVSFNVDLPVTLRVHDASTRHPDGTWNYATIIDAQLTASEQTDITQAIAWATAELTGRLDNPRALECSTFAQGWYPWQQAFCSFPERGINGPYLVQSTLLTDVGRMNGKPRVDLRLLEGSAIGRDWTQYFKQRAGSSGGGSSVSTGGGVPPAPGGGAGGAAGLPAGTTFTLAGDNVTAYTVTTTWQDAPQLSPVWLGGTGMAGQWNVWVPVYQLTAGTLELRLLDQQTQAPLATLISSAVGERLIGPFDFQQIAFTAPPDVHTLLLQWRTTAGSRQAVMGHAHVRKL